MKKNALLGLLIISILLACNDKEDLSKDFVIGKNLFTTKVDGDVREYYVHVPSSYNENNIYPVVFMLHGTSGDGERFYNISGWTHIGDTENILTVFPSSGQYCVIDDGVEKNTTKWNVYPGTFEYCDGVEPMDDINFLRQVIAELKERFNVDNSRVYLAGFSNGGQMAFRCAVEMSDIFAAIVESGGSYALDTMLTPLNNIPVTFQLGNIDPMWLFDGRTSYPMDSFELALDSFPLFLRISKTHSDAFDFESSFTMSGDQDVALIANYPGATASPPREFNFVLIKDLAHNYPNGKNHPINGARQNWEWMKQYTLP